MDTFHTTHRGKFYSITATGKELEWTSVAIFKLSNGKIIAEKENADITSIMKLFHYHYKKK